MKINRILEKLEYGMDESLFVDDLTIYYKKKQKIEIEKQHYIYRIPKHTGWQRPKLWRKRRSSQTKISTLKKTGTRIYERAKRNRMESPDTTAQMVVKQYILRTAIIENHLPEIVTKKIKLFTA